MTDRPDIPAVFEEELLAYRDYLKIDKHKLDEEIAIQADLYYRISARTAEAISYRDRAKHDAAICEAEAAQQIRETSAIHGEKTTESGIKELVTIDKEVITCQRHHILWDRLAREWQAMQQALDQRGRMLRDMVQLYAAEYFVVTSAGRAENEMKDRKAEKGREVMSALRQKRLRDEARPRLRMAED